MLLKTVYCTMRSSIATIIPTLNEAGCIRACLNHLLAIGANDIVVVDGSSSDGTADIVRSEFQRIRLVEGVSAHRGQQMNIGVNHTRADILLFLHADLSIAKHSYAHILAAVERGALGGGFKKRYAPESVSLRLYAALLNTIYLPCFGMVGTNAMFVRRDVFQSIGGFATAGQMEDLVFSRALTQRGRIQILPGSVTVSARRYLRNGVVRQILINALLAFRFHACRVRSAERTVMKQPVARTRLTSSFHREHGHRY